MGVGDLTVPKRMQAFGEAFYGRAAAYASGLTAGEESLAAGAVQEYPDTGAEIEKLGSSASMLGRPLRR